MLSLLKSSKGHWSESLSQLAVALLVCLCVCQCAEVYGCLCMSVCRVHLGTCLCVGDTQALRQTLGRCALPALL